MITGSWLFVKLKVSVQREGLQSDPMHILLGSIRLHFKFKKKYSVVNFSLPSVLIVVTVVC